MKTTDKAGSSVLQHDKSTLEHLGYKQELARKMSGFSNFALSFSVIGLLLGLSANFQAGFSVVGGSAVGVNWLVGGLFALIVAATLGQIASAYPTAGGLYHWSSILGGRGWGWGTAWLNLISYIFSLASVNVALYGLFNSIVLNGLFHVDISKWGLSQQIPAVIAITVSQAILNHLGVRLLSHLSNFGAWLNLGGCALLLVLMLMGLKHFDIAGLFELHNYSGEAGGNVVPLNSNPLVLFGMAMIFPLWIMTSFDASAHASEETVDAEHSVPKAMVSSVAISWMVGLIMSAAFVFAMPDQGKIAHEGFNIFYAILATLPVADFWKELVSVAIILCTYICGLCIMTGCSRAMYAFARDGGLPMLFGRVSPRYQSPAAAIWLSAVLAVLATLYTPAFASLAAGTAMFYYVSYAMPVVPALLALRAGWSRQGPFSLGRWFLPAGIVTLLGAVILFFVAIQPPNAILLNYAIGIAITLIVVWFAVERRRFNGPPTELHLATAATRRTAYNPAGK